MGNVAGGGAYQLGKASGRKVLQVLPDAQKEGIEVKIFAEGEEAMQQKELEKDQMLMRTLKTQRPEMMEDMQKVK